MIRPKYDSEFFYHWTEIPVRFRDLDPLNHVNNALFNTYLEEARIQFLGEVGQKSVFLPHRSQLPYQLAFSRHGDDIEVQRLLV